MASVTVDFIAKGSDSDPWAMVLVEEGPWAKAEVEGQLQRIQDRLYGCIEAALEGQLAEQFPASKGKAVAVRLDCYNVPRTEVTEFFERFSRHALRLSGYEKALKSSAFVSSLSFEVTFDAIH